MDLLQMILSALGGGGAVGAGAAGIGAPQAAMGALGPVGGSMFGAQAANMANAGNMPTAAPGILGSIGSNFGSQFPGGASPQVMNLLSGIAGLGAAIAPQNDTDQNKRTRALAGWTQGQAAQYNNQTALQGAGSNGGQGSMLNDPIIAARITELMKPNQQNPSLGGASNGPQASPSSAQSGPPAPAGNSQPTSVEDIVSLFSNASARATGTNTGAMTADLAAAISSLPQVQQNNALQMLQQRHEEQMGLALEPLKIMKAVADLKHVQADTKRLDRPDDPKYQYADLYSPEDGKRHTYQINEATKERIDLGISKLDEKEYFDKQYMDDQGNYRIGRWDRSVGLIKSADDPLAAKAEPDVKTDEGAKRAAYATLMNEFGALLPEGWAETNPRGLTEPDLLVTSLPQEYKVRAATRLREAYNGSPMASSKQKGAYDQFAEDVIKNLPIPNPIEEAAKAAAAKAAADLLQKDKKRDYGPPQDIILDQPQGSAALANARNDGPRLAVKAAIDETRSILDYNQSVTPVPIGTRPLPEGSPPEGGRDAGMVRISQGDEGKDENGRFVLVKQGAKQAGNNPIDLGPAEGPSFYIAAKYLYPGSDARYFVFGKDAVARLSMFATASEKTVELDADMLQKVDPKLTREAALKAARKAYEELNDVPVGKGP